MGAGQNGSLYGYVLPLIRISLVRFEGLDLKEISALSSGILESYPKIARTTSTATVVSENSAKASIGQAGILSKKLAVAATPHGQATSVVPAANSSLVRCCLTLRQPMSTPT